MLRFPTLADYRLHFRHAYVDLCFHCDETLTREGTLEWPGSDPLSTDGLQRTVDAPADALCDVCEAAREHGAHSEPVRISA